MKLTSPSFQHQGKIPTRFAFGKYNAESHVELSDNLNPELHWSDLPEGTRSLALLCIDSDAPTSPENVNKEGVTVPYDLPRADFAHWALVNISPSQSSIAEGEYSNGVTAGGKSDAQGPNGTRQGANNYTQWFEGDVDMEGTYLGYDGPCPPWNDERIHNYHFTLYALDLEECPVGEHFTTEDVLQAIQGHILGEVTLTGSYAIYPDAR